MQFDFHPRMGMYVEAYAHQAVQTRNPRGRVYFETRLRELAKMDEQGVHWKQTPRDLFLQSYAAWFLDVPFSLGFFYSLLQDSEEYFKTGQGNPIHLLDMYEQRHRGTTPIKIKERDPLGVHGPPDGTEWRTMPLQYFTEIPEGRRSEIYITHLRMASKNRMMDDIYEDELNHYRALEQRIAEMVSIISKTTEEVLHFPGDGIGVGSLAASMLGRKYVSSEPNGIGELARRLGIITRDWPIEQHIASYPEATYVLSNLSRFMDMAKMSQQVRAIIYDVSMTQYPHYSKIDEQGVLTQNHPIMSAPALIPTQSVRPIDEMLIPNLKPVDDKTRVHLIQNNKLEETSSVTASVTVQEAEPNSFVLSMRKYLHAPARRYGEVQVLDGFVNHYEETVHRVYNNKGFRTSADRPYKLQTILSSEYDLKGRKQMLVRVKFNPSRLKWAYNFGRIRSVEPLNIEKVCIDEYEVLISLTTERLVGAKLIDRGYFEPPDRHALAEQNRMLIYRNQQLWEDLHGEDEVYGL